MIKIILVYLFINVAVAHLGLFEGDKCLTDSLEPGECTLVTRCAYAIKLLKSKMSPTVCGFKGSDAIVCCPPTPGERSEKYCHMNYPKQSDIEPAYLGRPTLAKEYPHMAALGYGDKDNILWYCGGSLISKKYVLTAAHCLQHREYGDVKWVRLGDLNLKITTDDADPQDFTIAERIAHPEYRGYSHYHDIALLKLDGNATFNDYVKPACLYTKKSRPPRPSVLIATGWGQISFTGPLSDHLLQVSLNIISPKQCKQRFNKGTKKLKNGIDNKIQLCAGHHFGNDTCPGDSGGPLQYKVFTLPSYHYVVGITSFGKDCGSNGKTDSVGVYTRVSSYVKWIEDIVWPLTSSNED